MSEFELYPAASMVIPEKILTSDVSMRDPECPFCQIVRTRRGAVIVAEWTARIEASTGCYLSDGCGFE